jgi:hypothetical protein
MSEMTATAAAPAPQTTQTPSSASPAEAPAKSEGSGVSDFEDVFIVDGVERKMKYSEAKRELQKRAAAERRFEEASRMRNEAAQQVTQAKQIIDALQSRDRRLLEQTMGAEGLHEFAEQLIWEKIQNSKKSPEQLKLEEVERKVEEYENEKKTRAQQEKEAEVAQKVEQYKTHYSNMISKAIETSNLPKDATTVALMANILDSYRTHGYEPSTDELVASAMERYNAPVKSYLPAMTGEQLVKYLGDDIVAKIREYDLSQIKNPMRHRPQTPITQAPSSREERVFISPAELARMARKKAGLG